MIQLDHVTNKVQLLMKGRNRGGVKSVAVGRKQVFHLFRSRKTLSYFNMPVNHPESTPNQSPHPISLLLLRTSLPKPYELPPKSFDVPQFDAYVQHENGEADGADRCGLQANSAKYGPVIIPNLEFGR